MTSQPQANLLIIDDEAPHLKALCATLSDQGYAATGFTSARAALAALRERPFDLLLTDLMMPEMDGIAVLRAAQEKDPRLVGIVMTGHGTIDTAVGAMKQGALDYILKPFKLSTLLPVIARALAVRRLRLENELLQQRLHARTLELEAANKELETFSYSVSHDLRAPLRSVGGFVELLLEELGGHLNENGCDYVRHVRFGLERMNTLIEDLLRLARTSSTELHRVPLDLSGMAEEVVEKIRAAAGGRGGDWLIAPGLAAVGDPGLVRVVLENLFSNAWKYTARTARARIEFGAEPQPGGAPVFYVRDNGAGFDMKYADRLFGPFQRLHSEKEFPGTGVGLATVQRIVRKHGGRIWAEAAPDQGATFRFTLPPPPGEGALAAG